MCGQLSWDLDILSVSNQNRIKFKTPPSEGFFVSLNLIQKIGYLRVHCLIIGVNKTL
jgi:hypothetical protein